MSFTSRIKRNKLREAKRIEMFNDLQTKKQFEQRITRSGITSDDRNITSFLKPNNKNPRCPNCPMVLEKIEKGKYGCRMCQKIWYENKKGYLVDKPVNRNNKKTIETSSKTKTTNKSMLNNQDFILFVENMKRRNNKNI